MLGMSISCCLSNFCLCWVVSGGIWALHYDHSMGSIYPCYTTFPSCCTPSIYQLWGDAKIPHSRITKTCREVLVSFFLNVCDKSKKAICISLWWYRITILCFERRPSRLCEKYAIVPNCGTDTPRWFCVSLLKVCGEARHQNYLPLTTNLSQNVTEPSKGISYPVGDLYRLFTKLCLYFT